MLGNEECVKSGSFLFFLSICRQWCTAPWHIRMALLPINPYHDVFALEALDSTLNTCQATRILSGIASLLVSGSLRISGLLLSARAFQALLTTQILTTPHCPQGIHAFYFEGQMGWPPGPQYRISIHLPFLDNKRKKNLPNLNHLRMRVLRAIPDWSAQPSAEHLHSNLLPELNPKSSSQLARRRHKFKSYRFLAHSGLCQSIVTEHLFNVSREETFNTTHSGKQNQSCQQTGKKTLATASIQHI